jgi:formylglycine-generating enzyme required for sulfatase activity
MNTNLLDVIKEVVAKYGEAILSEPKRVSASLLDLARDEPETERDAFVECLKREFTTILKSVSESERDNCKQRLTQRLYDEKRLDLSLCKDTLALLAAVLFGEEKKAKQNNCTNCGKEIQEEWKACPYCGTPVESKSPVKKPAPIAPPKPVNKSGYEMVRVPGGSFQMGDTAGGGRDNERPVHTVTQSDFYMGKYEVTQAQYQAVMGNNPSKFKGGLPAQAGNLPDECVCWYDAIEFCNKLSAREGLTPYYTINKTVGSDPNNENEYDDLKWLVTRNTSADGYRLPTEAEWEYAAKGGNGSPGNYKYAGSNNVDEVAWYRDNSNSTTHEVGKKAPNGLGLYDMSGNVWEWCWDWDGRYSSEAQTDPMGASSGSYRVIRGGRWDFSAEDVRSAFRGYFFPNFRYKSGGFRLVRP